VFKNKRIFYNMRRSSYFRIYHILERLQAQTGDVCDALSVQFDKTNVKIPCFRATL